MNSPSAIALFCEDIREEESGQVSLIGVLGDNVIIAGAPTDSSPNVRGFIPKLCIYLRVSVDVNAEVKPIEFVVTMPNGEIGTRGLFDEATIATAQKTREHGNPIAGLVSRLVMSNLVIPSALGRITVTVTIDGQTYVAGALNFIAPTSS